MALSGTLNTTNYQGRYVQFSWTATQDIAKNQSTISWTLKGAGDATSGYYNTGPVKLIIDGKTIYEYTSRMQLYEGTVIKTGTTVIKHGTNGKKSFTAEVQAAIYKASINCKGSKTFTLNTIPRAAQISSAPDIYDTDNPTMKFTNPAGSNATLSVALVYDAPGTEYGYITVVGYTSVSSSATSYKFNLTDAQREILQKGAANSKTVKIRYFLRSVIDGNTYREEVARVCTIKDGNILFDSGYPTVKDAGTAIPNRSATTLTLTGDENTFIKYFSTATYDMSATARKHATVKSYKATCGTKSANSKSGTLANIESGSIVFTATDSRGYTASKTLNINLIDYINLTCYFAPNIITPDGQFKLAISGNYYNGSFGAADNYLRLQYRYKVGNGSYTAWTEITVPAPTSNNYSVTTTLTGLDYRQAHTFQVRALDQMQTITSGTRTIKSTPVFDWSEDDVNFNVPITAPLINGYNFGDWAKLWQGSYYMTENQTATLWAKVSTMAISGIVLVFSRYDVSAGEPLNQHWSYHYVPKAMVKLHEGQGSVFDLSTSTDSYRGSKYLYIYDDKIVGHANNDAIGTGNSGVKYTNNAFVLRYVFAI